jgi:hypothetical protein
MDYERWGPLLGVQRDHAGIADIVTLCRLQKTAFVQPFSRSLTCFEGP